MALKGVQFGRNAELVVGPKFVGNNRLIEPPLAKIFRTRIKFDIEKNDGSNPNKAKISIYNLNEDSRNFVEQDKTALILRVGYGDNLSVLFFGDLAKNGITTKRVGPDIITTLEAGDSEEIIKNANIQLGLAPGATNIQIINLAVEKLRLSAGPSLGITPVTYKNGFSFSGTIASLLDQITKQINIKWAINDGEITFLGFKETEPGRIIKLGPTTGLIGTPTKSKEGFKFNSLLNADIRPGKKVFVESKIALGDQGVTIKIQKAKYIGDTHEGNWVGKFEGAIL